MTEHDETEDTIDEEPGDEESMEEESIDEADEAGEAAEATAAEATAAEPGAGEPVTDRPVSEETASAEAPGEAEPLAAAEDVTGETTEGANGEGATTAGANGEATSGVAAEAQAVPFVVEEWMYGAVEALVFASNEPLSASRAREILAGELAVMEGREGMPEPSLGDMKAMFRTLLERWSDPTRSVAHGFRILELDGGLCFRTAAANARFIRRMQMGRPQRLSRATLETLAVIAYRQPVTKPQIEEVRGVDSSGAVKALLDKKLIRVLGKAEEIGRPLLYGTTKTFLEFFELQSLTDLPTLKELHELEHGVAEPVPVEGDDRPAVVMDLFNADQVSAVSEETERESNDALEALEQALGQAKDVAKRASSLVFGMEVEDGEDGAPRAAPLPGLLADDAAPVPTVEPMPAGEAAPAAAGEGAAALDEEPKA